MILNTIFGKCHLRLSSKGSIVFSSFYKDRGDDEASEHLFELKGFEKFRMTASISLKPSKTGTNSVKFALLVNEAYEPLENQKKLMSVLDSTLKIIQGMLSQEHMSTLIEEAKARQILLDAEKKANDILNKIGAKKK